ncbi:hypothetical protein HDV05_001781 [Chytridiales sp. JEL 0842]|nr:hypothetical protein HDV05_001781 [Chytridiales sp. JEL 0842]
MVFEGAAYFLRKPGWPSHFGSIFINAQYDLAQIYISTAFLMLVFFLIAVIPSFHWRKKKTYVLYLGTLVWIFIGWSLLFNIYGYNWQFGKVSTTTLYTSGEPHEVDVDIELRIGLFGFNVTCLGTPKIQHNYTIDWNEHFGWSYPWHQGRIGYGQFSAPVNQRFRNRENYGIPYPILYTAEYFAIDGEMLRWGRHFRMGGYFTYLIERTAFGGWIVCTVLYAMKALEAASTTTFLDGILVLSGVVVYWLQTSNRPADAPWDYTINPFRRGANFVPLQIPHAPHHDSVDKSQQFLTPTLSWSFYLTLVAGLLMVIIGILTRPNTVSKAYFKRSEDMDRMDLDDLVESWEERREFRRKGLFEGPASGLTVNRGGGTTGGRSAMDSLGVVSPDVAPSGGLPSRAQQSQTIRRLFSAAQRKKTGEHFVVGSDAPPVPQMMMGDQYQMQQQQMHMQQQQQQQQQQMHMQQQPQMHMQ